MKVAGWLINKIESSYFTEYALTHHLIQNIQRICEIMAIYVFFLLFFFFFSEMTKISVYFLSE